MELRDTIEMMDNADYKERFRAEFYQTHIRAMKLQDMLAKYKAGTLGFKPSCPFELLFEQAQHMGRYLLVLRARAEIEGIEL